MKQWVRAKKHSLNVESWWIFGIYIIYTWRKKWLLVVGSLQGEESWPKVIGKQSEHHSHALQKGIFVQFEAAKSWSSLLISPTIKINRGHHNYSWYIPQNPPKSPQIPSNPLALVPQEGADSAQDYQEARIFETVFPPMVDDVGDSTHHFWCWVNKNCLRGLSKPTIITKNGWFSFLHLILLNCHNPSGVYQTRNDRKRMSKPWWLWWQIFGLIPSSRY